MSSSWTPDLDGSWWRRKLLCSVPSGAPTTATNSLTNTDARSTRAGRPHPKSASYAANRLDAPACRTLPGGSARRRSVLNRMDAAGRGGRPSPEMPRGSGAPSRRGGGLVRLGPSPSVPQAGRPSPRGADPVMAGSLPAAGEDLRRRRGWMVAAAAGARGADRASESKRRCVAGERGKKIDVGPTCRVKIEGLQF